MKAGALECATTVEEGSLTLPVYEDGDDLASYLDAARSEFEAARAWYWDHSDQPMLRHAADLTGRQIVAAAFTLIDPTSSSEFPGIAWEQHQALAQHDNARQEVLEAVQLALATELHSDLGSMAERCEQLADQVFSTPPGAAVSKFLRRLTRCYVAGFFPECVILCRGVLENAIRELFQRRRVPIPATADGKSSMKATLAAAERFRLLSKSARRDADLVWVRGNKAVHEDIEATSDALGTIRLTTDRKFKRPFLAGGEVRRGRGRRGRAMETS